MTNLKKWIMKKKIHRDSNAFAVAIFCHGNRRGDLFDVHEVKGWDTEMFLEELSEVETLKGKPKIFVINACRGSKYFVMSFCNSTFSVKSWRNPVNIDFQSVVNIRVFFKIKLRPIGPICLKDISTSIVRLFYILQFDRELIDLRTDIY